MTFIADLHIHSHYSRATSPTLVPEDISLWARKKGIALVGTGDFTHPGWVSELREKLEVGDWISTQREEIPLPGGISLFIYDPLRSPSGF